MTLPVGAPSTPPTIAAGSGRALDYWFVVLFLGRGEPAAVEIEGRGLDATVRVKGRAVRFDGRKLVLAE